ncbi:MAG TPA: imidazoleglycerol-phosphate dehydratase HisB [Armatimonadota bacterium]|nr:imidazoleglycerol-phosphate dehydratase HisB [Armatimonadota bacterium]
MPGRTAEVGRQTKETKIQLRIDLDGSGESEINTGIGFFDHMLTALAKHGLFDLKIQAKGDLEIDPHHTVEDVGIVLGQAVDRALGDKAGIVRFGWAVVPMDRSLVLTSIDISGRGILCYDVNIGQEKIGAMDSVLISEFFESFARNAGVTLHIRQLSGEDPHHTAEAVFKSFAKCLEAATRISERIKGVPSTKGVL